MIPQDGKRKRRSRRRLITRRDAAIVLLATIAFQWHLLFFPLALDQSIYATSAMKMLEGKVLYRDTWDMKSPGIFFLYMIPLLAGAGNTVPIRVMHLLMQGLAALGMVATGRAFGFKMVGWCSAVVFLMMGGAWGTPITIGQPDDWMLPFFLWGLLLLWKAARERIPRRRFLKAFIAGILMGCVLLLRSTMLFAVMLAPMIWLTASVHHEALAGRKWLARLPLVPYVLGGLAIGLPALAYFVLAGSLYDLYHAQFVWVRQYAVTEITRDHAGGDDLVKLMRGRWNEFFRGYHAFNAWPFLSVVGTVLCYRLGTKSTWKYMLYTLIGMILAASNYWIQMKFFNYHHWPLVAFVSMFLGLFFAGIILLVAKAWPIQRDWRRIAAWLLLVIALIFWVQSDMMVEQLRRRNRQAIDWITGKADPKTYYDRFDFYHLYMPYEDYLIQEYIKGRDRVGPDGKPRLFIFAFRPQVYYNLGVSGPSKFAYNLPLRAAWSPKEWMENLEGEVMRDPPDFILMGRWDYYYWVTGNDKHSDDLAPPWLTRMMEEDFTKVMRLKFMDVYERNREDDPPIIAYPPKDVEAYWQEHPRDPQPARHRALPGGSR